MTPQKEGYAKLKWFSKFQSLKKYSRLRDCNRTRTDYHLIRKRTINHVAKLNLTFKYRSKPICNMRKTSSEYSRLCNLEKQSHRGTPWKRTSYKFHENQVISCDFYEIYKNTCERLLLNLLCFAKHFFNETLLVIVASLFPSHYYWSR